MEYLQRKDKPSCKAHIWNQQKKDTSCRMWSTGGLGKDNDYEIVGHTLKEVCTMCKNNLNKRDKPMKKRKRVFYYHEGVDAYVPLQMVDEIEHYLEDLEDKETKAIEFKVYYMTNEEFNNIEEI